MCPSKQYNLNFVVTVPFIPTSGSTSSFQTCVTFVSALLTLTILQAIVPSEGGWFVIFWLFKYILFFVNWISLYFSISYKILHYYVYDIYIYIYWLGWDRPSGLFFMPALLLSILTPLFFPSSSVCVSYFSLAIPMHECLGKHWCMSSQFPTAILNGIFFFCSVKAMNNWNQSTIKQILLK